MILIDKIINKIEDEKACIKALEEQIYYHKAKIETFKEVICIFKGSAITEAKNILKESSEPLHGKDIYKRLVERGYSIKEQSLMVALSKHKDIQRVSPNTWIYDDENTDN